MAAPVRTIGESAAGCGRQGVTPHAKAHQAARCSPAAAPAALGIAYRRAAWQAGGVGSIIKEARGEAGGAPLAALAVRLAPRAARLLALGADAPKQRPAPVTPGGAGAPRG